MYWDLKSLVKDIFDMLSGKYMYYRWFICIIDGIYVLQVMYMYYCLCFGYKEDTVETDVREKVYSNRNVTFDNLSVGVIIKSFSKRIHVSLGIKCTVGSIVLSLWHVLMFCIKKTTSPPLSVLGFSHYVQI